MTHETFESTLGALLSAAEVRELLGDRDCERVDALIQGRRLIELVDSAERHHFPSFQFHDDQPVEPLVAAFWVVADAAVSRWTAASWAVSPDPALDGLSPAEWAREGHDPDRLLTIARQDAARLAR